MNHQLELRLPGEISNLRYADDTTLMAESEEELKSLLMQQIDGEEMEVVTDFIFLGSKITTDGDCRCLLLGRKAMANLDSILKSRDITLPTKVRIVKAMVFPVAMYDCESWTIRKAERRRIEAFELWCWRRLLQVPWTARRSNESGLEEINPDCSLEGQILKMKLKYFGHLMRRKDSLEKSLMLRTIDGKRRRRRQRMRWLDGVTEAVSVSLGGLQGMMEDRKAWSKVVHRVVASQEELKAAYRRLCMLYHPDKHRDPELKRQAEQLFNLLHQAYEVLSDPQTRAIYDIYGKRGLDMEGWEVVERRRTPAEIREEFERLQREREERRLQQRTNPKHYQCICGFTDLKKLEGSSSPREQLPIKVRSPGLEGPLIEGRFQCSPLERLTPGSAQGLAGAVDVPGS
ncbi:hypothetical protein EYD10_17082 [Varanus komodoensis]|nr:hypothetical protein EYD10_17082 [Varanus komodoensis]